MPTTLIAVSGMSPAIITETLWALAHESPPTVPDEILVITTSKGEADIQSQLLAPLPAWQGQTVWHTLRCDILKLAKLPAKSPKLQLSIRVIELPDTTTGIRRKAADIRSRDDNAQAADFIIQTLAPIADAADQRLIASIAGGRKTMGALLYAAMSLLGKEADRCTHVLVSDPYDTLRGFYYPAQPATVPLKDFKSEISNLKAADARIDLADIPFVPLRNKFAELNERRTFAGLVETYSRAERPVAKGKPRVSLDEEKSILTVEDRAISLAGRELLLTAFLHRRALAGQPHFVNKDEAAAPLSSFNADWKKQHPFHKASARLTASALTTDDIPKALSSLRKKLTAAGLAATIPCLAPERARIGFDLHLA